MHPCQVNMPSILLWHERTTAIITSIPSALVVMVITAVVIVHLS
jgi:hypothetical protein